MVFCESSQFLGQMLPVHYSVPFLHCPMHSIVTNDKSLKCRYSVVWSWFCDGNLHKPHHNNSILRHKCVMPLTGAWKRVGCARLKRSCLFLSALPVRHWRMNTGGRACMRCLPRAWNPKQKSLALIKRDKCLEGSYQSSMVKVKFYSTSIFTINSLKLCIENT